MIFINTNLIFKDAFLNKNINVLENILSYSDSRIDILREFTSKEDIDEFRKILPEFRSKGLVRNIEDYCDLLEAKYSDINIKKENKSIVIKYINHKNIEINKIKYHRDDTFQNKSN